MAERYIVLRDIGAGGYAVAKLARDKRTNELVAIKYMKRGEKIDAKVEREVFIHKSLKHPNVIRFKEIFVTPTHLAIVMEYAAGGELLVKTHKVGRIREEEGRYYFQQLIAGISYIHHKDICHRDLKLENILLDGNTPPRVKICDFGFSKSGILHSRPKSAVGSVAYIAPEVLLQCKIRTTYDGKLADVWAIGVALFGMLTGEYPFLDPVDPDDMSSMMQRIVDVNYSIPKDVRLSSDCKHLLSRIFVFDVSKRITIPEIKKHPWYLKNLPKELMEMENTTNNELDSEKPRQSDEEIMYILQEARTLELTANIENLSLDD